jgi:hypothetical protein
MCFLPDEQFPLFRLGIADFMSPATLCEMTGGTFLPKVSDTEGESEDNDCGSRKIVQFVKPATTTAENKMRNKNELTKVDLCTTWFRQVVSGS